MHDKGLTHPRVVANLYQSQCYADLRQQSQTPEAVSLVALK